MEPIEDLEDLYENAPCGYLSLQPDGRIVKSNATLSRWIGTPAEQLIGKRLRDLLTMPGRIFYETHFAPLLRMQGFFNEVALDLLTSDGKVLPMLANALEKRDGTGKLMFTRVTLFQATERRKYERELVDRHAAAADAGAQAQRSLRSAQEEGELREQFIAVLGHDLRNPVASIGAGTRLMLKEPQTERGRQLLELLQGSVTRMSGLIDNLMDFARGRLGGGITLQRDADLPLEPVLLQVISELQTAYPERSIEVRIEIEEPVNCDRTRVGQLVSNLLGNALTHGEQDKPIRIFAGTADDAFEFSVANAGTALSDETMAHLFQPFFRGSVRPSQQGLGLGLYIAAKIAEAHGGTLTAERLGDEIRFTFRYAYEARVMASPPVAQNASRLLLRGSSSTRCGA